jgi:hypothetical protein
VSSQKKEIVGSSAIYPPLKNPLRGFDMDRSGLSMILATGKVLARVSGPI